MPRIDDLSGAEFMKLQSVRRQPPDLSDLYIGRRAASAPGAGGGDAVSDEVKGTLALVLYAVTGWLRTA
jgi:hypothetical protein